MKFSIVITTIYMPVMLETLAGNLERYGRKDEAEVIVIGDNKTPAGTGEYVSRLAAKGFHFEYWDVAAQKKWLERFPEIEAMVPYNTDNRRNVGYLIAYERGSERLIAMDDDNYPAEDEDYLGGHDIVGKTVKLTNVRSKNGWYNVCDGLIFEGDKKVYPRGYPYANRWQDESHERYEADVRVDVNSGLWLSDPDIDAVTRLNGPVNSIGLKDERIALAPLTNSPFNTQNTAFARYVTPVSYYVVMGFDLGGLRIDRYGDIWTSYFAKKVIDRMGGSVAFGRPLTIHQRHPHDLLVDLGQEYWGMVLTNRLAEMLGAIELKEETFEACYRELSVRLEEKVREDERFSEGVKSYFFMICKNMRVWTDVCNELKG